MMLMITTTALPALGESLRYGGSGQIEHNTPQKLDITLDVAITTDWGNDWQDHGLRIREFPLDGEVWAYTEISNDDLYGVSMTQQWWYDNGTGLENKWEWTYVVDGHWSSSCSWSWWQIGLDYGPGVGYISLLVDGEYFGETNWYAIDNTQPNKPTITGETEGKKGEEIEYKFLATDPDGFEISYLVDWGDNTTSDWTEYVASGTEIALKHTWDTKDDYQIKCKVRDLAHNESDWETLDITIPKNKAINFNFILLEWIFNRFPNAFPVLRHLFRS